MIWLSINAAAAAAITAVASAAAFSVLKERKVIKKGGDACQRKEQICEG